MASNKKSVSKKDDFAALAQVEFLMELMNKHRISDLEWENNQGRIALRSGVYVAPVASQNQATVSAAAPVPAVAAQKTAAAPVAAAPAANQKQITSPFVGTFYRAASPTAQPYVKEGQTIKRGDVLCIIEAMKLMNEIEAEVSGKVLKILVENGSPVEFGEPLFLIES